MRYRIRITRVQVAERSVLAKDEEHAMEKISAELDKPYGLLGQWQPASTEAEIVAVEPRDGLTPTIPGEGPLLMSIKDTATHLESAEELMEAAGLMSFDEVVAAAFNRPGSTQRHGGDDG